MTSSFSTPSPFTTAVNYDDLWLTTSGGNDSANVTNNVTKVNIDYGCYSITHNMDQNVLMSHKIYLFASIFFVIVGLIGNTLSFLVFSSKEMRTVSSNVYLLVLAISDSMYLISVFLTKTLTTLRCLYFTDSEADISNRHTILCKLLQFLLDLFSDYSTCLIMAFTIERYFAVYRPIKFKEICTVQRARISCLAIVGIITLTISPYHMLYMGRPKNFNVCTVLLQHEDIFTAFYISEMLLYRMIPVFIIAVLNVFIVVRVTQVTRKRKKRKSSVIVINNNKKKKQKREDRSMQLTIMLILVSTSYILAYLPVLIHFIVWKLERWGLVQVPYKANVIWQNYARAAYISGFAINFFLYTMSGRVFREQLEHIVKDCGDAAKREKDYTHVTTADTSVL